LPPVESVVVVFIGATTENPGFEINRALLSRAIVYPLLALSESDLLLLLKRALAEDPIIKSRAHLWTDEALHKIAYSAQGDARQALNQLEAICAHLSSDKPVSDATLMAYLKLPLAAFDQQGDLFYDQISALHKSVRGSDPDASLYWLCRMLASGTDPLYLARRLTRIASEDIGNADLRALQLCLQAWDVQQRLGSPEGELALAQAVLYCAAAPKSNAVYRAYQEMQDFVQRTPGYSVPLHLRNAPTVVHENIGASQGYRYPHDFPEAFVPGETYWPDEIHAQEFYQPVDRGLEAKIRAKLEHLKGMNQKASAAGSGHGSERFIERRADEKD
jgi:putative ATPase